MRIAVDGIPASGRQVDFGLNDAWAVAAATTALEHPPASLSGRVELTLASRKGLVQVQVQVAAVADGLCHRCADGCMVAVEEDRALLYGAEEIEAEAYDGGELELSANELDIGWYAEGQIDLGAVLGEAMALALPWRIVCTDTAACDMRTADLLGARASSDVSSAFAQLASLKLSKSDKV